MRDLGPVIARLGVTKAATCKENAVMRIRLAVGCISLLCGVASCLADDPPRASSKAELGGPAVDAILREASEIALKQDQEQRYWTQRVLLHIGDLQIQAGDFEGALRSIRGSSYDYGRNAGLSQLAEALARQGQRERAFDTLRVLGSGHRWRQDYLEDEVQLRWIEWLIASGAIERAGKAVGELKSKRYRVKGLWNVAAAYARSGDADRATQEFTVAVSTAFDLKDERDRAWALLEIAEAQLSVGRTDQANTTIRRLLEPVESKDPWVRFVALKEGAVLAAKAKDDDSAHALFRRAIDAQSAVNEMNKTNALMNLAAAQAEVGYVRDALKTASMIPQAESRYGEALFAIAVAQLRANDAEGAVRTGLSIKDYLQYRDDALHAIVDHQIAKRDLKGALDSAQKPDNPSRKAAAILKVATAHARAGDRKSAADVAAQVELTPRSTLLRRAGKELFDYRLARTWGVRYDDTDSFTNASHHWSSERAAEVAAAAMTLAQALGQKPDESYAILFNNINTKEVIQALARAQAARGDAREALAWAKEIGRSSKAKSDDDDYPQAVERRIHALMGVAEGILERSRDLPKTRP
jgi:tetratricopeptide (TPR) repeat protein